MASPHGAAVRLITPAQDSAMEEAANAVRAHLVDASGSAISSFGGGTQYTEDAAAAADPTGTQLIARRRDSLSTETTTDGDNTAVNSTGKGELYVKHVDSVPVTDNGGSLTVDGTVAATQSGTWNVGTVTTVTNVVHVDDNSSSLTVDDGGGSLTVDGTVGVSGTVTVDSELTTADLDTGAGTDTRAVVGLIGSKSGGGQLIPGDATAGLKVDLGADNDVTVTSGTITTITNVVHVDDNASTLSVDDGGGSLTVDGTVAATQSGTWTVQPGNTANTTAWKVDASSVAVPVTDNSGSLTVDQATASSLNAQVVGAVAHDGVDSGNPLKIGGKANSAVPTSVAAGDRVDAWFGLDGSQVGSGAFREVSGSGSASNATPIASTYVPQYNSVSLYITGTFTATVVFEQSHDGSNWTSFALARTDSINAGYELSNSWSNSGYTFMGPLGGSYFRVRIQSYTSGTVTCYATFRCSGSSPGASAIRVVGAVAHDTADVGNPIKIGGKAVTSLPTAVANLDRVDASYDAYGAALVTGLVAHDAVDAGNPQKIGMRAIAHGSNPTAVAAADRTDWLANRHGVPWVIGGHPNIVTVRANYTAAQTDTAIVTVSAGTKIVVTRCSVTADNANTVDVAARVGFGTANTPTTTGVILSHPGIAKGSGVVEGSGAGILGVGADNEDLRITSEVPTTGSIDVVVSYYTIES